MMGFNLKPENLQLIFGLYCDMRHENPENIILMEEKVFVNVTHAFGEPMAGTLIIPRDGSYVRFISDSWYNDIDVHNL